MEQEVRVDEGVSILDILKLLLSKIKLFILVGIVGAILGAGYAVYTTVDLNYFGTEVQFYVNPRKDNNDVTDVESNYSVYGAYGTHIMDNMVKLLSSDSFMEVLMLNGEELPDPTVWATAEENTRLKLPEKVSAAETALEEANEALELATQAIAAAKAATIDYGAEDHRTLAAVAAAEAANEVAITTSTAANNIKQIALDAWSKTSMYKWRLSQHRAAISFRYLSAGESATNSNNLARSFIYVSISTLNDEPFANEALDKVKRLVPLYVEENMTVPGGYDGTNCRRVTRTDDVRMTNPGYTKNQAIKYAILLGVASAAVAAVIVIVVDRLDKRLRDPDIISKKFNVPILGIVPNIDMETQAEEETKKAAEVK